MSKYHIPVMPMEAMEYLNIKKDCWYIDCNLGGGGHTKKILEAGGNVIGIDLDKEAIEAVRVQGIGSSDRLILKQSNFSKIDSVISSIAKDIKIKGILFDLGVSSHQLEKSERGFSFNTDAPLDMRMDQSAPQATAADLVNGLHENELADLFWVLGEENFSKPIAKKIAEYRNKKLITTTNELANIILSVRRRSPGDRTHPATRIFQALRIAVNDELNALREALPKAFEILSPNGRLVVISFHSLEDRIVKNFFKGLEEIGKAKILTDRPIEPSETEINENPRSRSGKLRAIEKI